jgi:hypothetical protein
VKAALAPPGALDRPASDPAWRPGDEALRLVAEDNDLDLLGLRARESSAISSKTRRRVHYRKEMITSWFRLGPESETLPAEPRQHRVPSGRPC